MNRSARPAAVIRRRSVSDGPVVGRRRQPVGVGSETTSGPQPVVSVIVPTYNEVDNIEPMLDRLAAALDGMHYEIVVVDDDSADQTWRVAEARAAGDPRITVIRRTGERGLSSAVLTGMTRATGLTLIVIDADLQHDERKIPELVSAIVDNGFDLCLASRTAAGGSYGRFGRRRRLVSWAGASLARLLLGVPVTDPMSGFFAVSRPRFELIAGEINPRGFKILLEFLARGPKPYVAEVGYQFGQRVNGTTKLNGSVVLDYLGALMVLATARLRSGGRHR